MIGVVKAVVVGGGVGALALRPGSEPVVNVAYGAPREQGQAEFLDSAV